MQAHRPARTVAYRHLAGNSPAMVTPAYERATAPVIRLQLEKAAVRLAYLLGQGLRWRRKRYPTTFSLPPFSPLPADGSRRCTPQRPLPSGGPARGCGSRILAALLLVSAPVYGPASAFAWGREGHTVIAILARGKVSGTFSFLYPFPPQVLF